MNKVTYISHSGYMIETRNAVFIFDYYKGTLPEFSKEKDLYIFASHTHFDHFKKKIFQITKEGTPIQFILSDDINKSVVKSKEAAMVMANQITFMGPNEVQTIGDCQVRTLRSTDEGVAFLIHTTDLCIYHGGDLNWWHWNQENDIFNEMMKRKFQYEINKLADETIDFAFLPLDSRLENAYAYGIDYFMRHTKTTWAFPMHFWNDYNICNQLLTEPFAQVYKEHLMVIEKEGQEFEFE